MAVPPPGECTLTDDAYSLRVRVWVSALQPASSQHYAHEGQDGSIIPVGRHRGYVVQPSWRSTPARTRQQRDGKVCNFARSREAYVAHILTTSKGISSAAVLAAIAGVNCPQTRSNIEGKKKTTPVTKRFTCIEYLSIHQVHVKIDGKA